MPRRVSPQGPWEERHRRVTFYAEDDLRAWIEDEMRRTGQSKTEVIVGALEEARSARTPAGGHSRRSPRDS
jgi:hypothetical protein